MIGKTYLALGVFIIIMLAYLVVTTIQKSKKTMTEKLLEKKFEEEKDDFINPNQPEIRKGFLGKIERDLIDAQLNIDIRVFVMLIIVFSIILYIGAYYVFGQPLVSFAPLPFSLYFVPKMFLDFKKEKQMERFESELVQILRRMSSVLKNGSVLQALEDVKDLPSLSEKSRILLNEIYHRYKYGDSIESAFYKVADKSGSNQFKLCAISIDINKELGSDLSQSLNEVALSIQQLRLSEKESKSLKAQSVMIGRILSIVPFFIIGFMMTQNKEYFETYLQTIDHQLIFMFLFSIMFVGIYIVETIAKQK
jgi:Flp pilus assembly protein TadB